MYQPVIGLEVHAQLKTNSKIFCGCSTEFGSEPNSQVCPVCLGFPGSLPVLNKTALDYAVKTGLALGCSIQNYTKFDRKHYYYPDLPKNYQISQYDLPVCKDGFLDIEIDGKTKRVRVRRAHLEEDAGKLMHQDKVSFVDLNRTGVPLLEIVSEPDMHSPVEAYEYLVSLKSIIEYLGVCDCDMEKGSLRCDANISIRKKGDSKLGIKTELKNMNSFKGVRDALAFEIQRQSELLDKGESLIQETRLWDAKELKTVSMRTKEEAKDYRYFPEPDLPPFLISQEKIEEISKTMPELPKAKCARFIKDYGLLESDAKILVFSKKDSDYAEQCMKIYNNINKKPVVNLIIGPLLSEANSRNCSLTDLKLQPQNLIELLSYIDRDEVSNLTAKSVLKDMIDSGQTAAKIIKDKNLVQISDTNALESQVEEVIKLNPKSVEDYRLGKVNALMFLVGQVMKRTAGKANPKVVREILNRRLNNA
ncbi:MAG: Asp-tRNA(Asn)/Glu-tRNA(Gln) amidotransferase subunit GatB [Candidatus Omnitrophota bacterium]